MLQTHPGTGRGHREAPPAGAEQAPLCAADQVRCCCCCCWQPGQTDQHQNYGLPQGRPEWLAAWAERAACYWHARSTTSRVPVVGKGQGGHDAGCIPLPECAFLVSPPLSIRLAHTSKKKPTVTLTRNARGGRQITTSSYGIRNRNPLHGQLFYQMRPATTLERKVFFYCRAV